MKVQNGNPLLKKFLEFAVGNLLSFIIGAVSTPIITRLFLPDQLGVASMYTLAINFTAVLVVLGCDQAYVRFYYEENQELRPALLRNTLTFPLLIFSVSSFFALVFQDNLSNVLFDMEVEFIGIAIVLGVFFTSVQRFGFLVVRMEQKAKTFSFLLTTFKVLTLVLIVIFYYYWGASFQTLIWAQLVTVGGISVLAVVFGINQWKQILIKGDEKHTLFQIIHYSFPLVLTTLLMWVIQSIDRIAVRHFADYQELGFYVAAFRIVAVFNIIQSSFATFWSPVAYEKYEKSKDDAHFFKKIHVLVSISMLTLGFVTILCKDLIALILGNEYVASAQIMPFLIFVPIMYTISETTSMGIGFKKKSKLALYISIVVCAINILGNYYLVPLYGGIGAAIATGASYVVFLILRTVVSYKLFQVDYSFFRLSASIAVLLVYAAFASFNETSMTYYLLGFIGIMFVFLIYLPILMQFRRTFTRE